VVLDSCKRKVPASGQWQERAAPPGFGRDEARSVKLELGTKRAQFSRSADRESRRSSRPIFVATLFASDLNRSTELSLSLSRTLFLSVTLVEAAAPERTAESPAARQPGFSPAQRARNSAQTNRRDARKALFLPPPGTKENSGIPPEKYR
jgi:hypothetical protein